MLAPFLIVLSLIGTPVMIDPSAPSSVETMTVEATETPITEQTPVEQPPVEQPLSGISVDLECLAYPDGYVAQCAVVNETRPGLGFGEAAVALMNGSTVGPNVQTHRSAPVKFRHTIEFTPD